MDISAVMNIHELAMTKIIRQQTHAQARQKEMNLQVKAQEANQAKTTENKTSIEAYPGVFTNTVERQEDPQGAKIGVERQTDVQAAKETVQGAEEEAQAKEKLQETGTLIDIMT